MTKDADDPAQPDASARLQEQRAAISAQISGMEQDMAAMFAASRDSNADDEHDPEGQTIAFERAQLAALTDRARAHLADIDAALGRVDDGSYGLCAACHRPISAARLEARPTAATCVDHAGSAQRR